jgi:hypothetical protein
MQSTTSNSPSQILANRCVHCRLVLVEQTQDHVFPKSWYPTSTPPEVQRWTVPSCEKCNRNLGKIEKELFVRLALCVDPRKVAVAGLSEKAVRSMGVRAKNLTIREMRHREALKSRIMKEIRPYKASTADFPGLARHAGFPGVQQYQVEFPKKSIKAVAEKIVRGCEYMLSQKRIIEPPYLEQIYFADEANIPDVLKAFKSSGPTHLGPGFRIARAAARDDAKSVMYKIDVWDTWTIYGVILPGVREQQRG